MRQIIVMAVSAVALGGCASFSSLSMDSLRPAPPTVNVQLESVPPGADAVTSVGPGCKTPCSVAVPAGNFTVSYSLARYQPATVPVTATVIPGDFTSAARTVIDPDPVVAELQPAAPPPRRVVRRAVKKKRPGPAAPPAAASPFPAPPAR